METSCPSTLSGRSAGLSLPLRVWEVPGSDLGRDRGYTRLRYFVIFLSPYRQMSALSLKLGHNRFPPYPFQCIIHIIILSFDDRKCEILTASFNKQQTKITDRIMTKFRLWIKVVKRFKFVPVQREPQIEIYRFSWRCSSHVRLTHGIKFECMRYLKLYFNRLKPKLV